MRQRVLVIVSWVSFPGQHHWWLFRSKRVSFQLPDSLDSDPLSIDFVLDKHLWLSRFAQLPFCGYCRNLKSQDCSRIYCFIKRTVNLGYLSIECPTFNALVTATEDRLLSPVIHNSYHVHRPLFSPILTRRPGLHKQAHPFTLPLKDDRQRIPHVLFRALLPPFQP